MFLFTINTIFIALATFVIVKFLNFPMLKYINSAKRKRIAQFASTVAFLIFAGSIWQFYGLFKENQFKQTANTFIKELKDDGVAIIGENEKNIDYFKRTITLPIIGQKNPDSEISKWRSRLNDMGLTDVKLNIQQEDDSEMRKQVENLQDLYSQNQKIITSRDESIKEKEDRIRLLESELSKYYDDQIPFKTISEESKINYDGIEEMSYYRQIKTDFNKIDSLNVFSVKWKKGLNSKDLINQEQKLNKWLKKRLELDTLKVVRE